MSIDIGPVYHPDDADYIKRWHEARGDVETEPGSGVWRNSKSLLVIHIADFKLPADYKPGVALIQDENGHWHMPPEE